MKNDNVPHPYSVNPFDEKAYYAEIERQKKLYTLEEIQQMNDEADQSFSELDGGNKMKNEKVDNHMSALCEKHLSLVRYARNPEGSEHYGTAAYPEEVAKLIACETNFEHGFNSGVVAAVRYLFTLQDQGIDLADDSFPELYS